MASPRSRPADLDFDTLLSRRPEETELLGFRTVMVNPFLAILAMVGWYGAMQADWLTNTPPAALLVSMATVASLPYLIQYHCLDCGMTGALPNCKYHFCTGVVDRWRHGRRSWLGWPRPGTQMVWWLWTIGAGAVLLTVARHRMMG